MALANRVGFATAGERRPARPRGNGTFGPTGRLAGLIKKDDWSSSMRGGSHAESQ
jgi:hypothetical protein